MAVAQLLNQSAVIIHRAQTGEEDKYGTPTWTETETEVSCHVQPVSSDEVEDRPAGRFTHRGFLLPGTLIGHADQLFLETGQGWEVDGPAREWLNPRTGVVSHLEVDLVGYTDTEPDVESSS